MKMQRYNRSPVLSLGELTDEQQADHIDDTGAEDTSYVLFNWADGSSALRLDEFIRHSIFPPRKGHGSKGTSFFDGFIIYLSRDGEEAIVARYSW